MFVSPYPFKYFSCISLSGYQGQQLVVILCLYAKMLRQIEGFRVTSYEANFASHHTRDRHVGFHSQYFVRGTQQNVQKVTRILTHT